MIVVIEHVPDRERCVQALLALLEKRAKKTAATGVEPAAARGQVGHELREQCTKTA
jgi:hypothetical protein